MKERGIIFSGDNPKEIELDVAFELSDPLGKEVGIDLDSSEQKINNGRIRAHLHALDKQPKYRRWFFSELSNRERFEHQKAASVLRKLLANPAALARYIEKERDL